MPSMGVFRIRLKLENNRRVYFTNKLDFNFSTEFKSLPKGFIICKETEPEPEGRIYLIKVASEPLGPESINI